MAYISVRIPQNRNLILPNEHPFPHLASSRPELHGIYSVTPHWANLTGAAKRDPAPSQNVILKAQWPGPLKTNFPTSPRPPRVFAPGKITRDTLMKSRFEICRSYSRIYLDVDRSNTAMGEHAESRQGPKTCH